MARDDAANKAWMEFSRVHSSVRQLRGTHPFGTNASRVLSGDGKRPRANVSPIIPL